MSLKFGRPFLYVNLDFLVELGQNLGRIALFGMHLVCWLLRNDIMEEFVKRAFMLMKPCIVGFCNINHYQCFQFGSVVLIWYLGLWQRVLSQSSVSSILGTYYYRR